MTELWQPVPDSEGRYFVSDRGRVRSHIFRQPRILTATIAKNGYPTVNLRMPQRRWVTPVHVLVCSAFHGPRPLGMEVRHLDGNKLNNAAENLAWGTARENQQDNIRHGTHGWASRTHCINGHEFTPENTSLKAGYRICRACRTASSVRYNEKRKAERALDPLKSRKGMGRQEVCLRGHDLADAHVVHSGPQAGRRNCRTCALARMAKYYAARKQKAATR